MVLERLQQMSSHLTGSVVPHHPFDPLTRDEIAKAVAIVRESHSDLFFNAITLLEPPKVEMMRWVENPKNTPRPHRIADVVTIGRGSKVYDGHVDLDEGKLLS